MVTEPTPVRATEFGLSFPKGALLLGVPGCGKSLCAKAVAHEWGLPLLKLDPANLYDKYIGDSEKNFKRAMQTAERLAPIVLWIDTHPYAWSDARAALMRKARVAIAIADRENDTFWDEIAKHNFRCCRRSI